MTARAYSRPRPVTLDVASRRPEDLDQLRLITKVAHLYHRRGVRQPEIAGRLHISQSRVSRLLAMAEELGIVRTVVVPPPGIYAGLEEEIEARYGLIDVHIVDIDETATESEIAEELGAAAAAYLQPSLFDLGIVGCLSWSRPVMSMVAHLEPTQRQAATIVVEMLGSLGNPGIQLDVSQSTRRLAELLGAQPAFLPTPGVAATPELRDAIVAQDSFARRALELHDHVDFALVGIGTVGLSELLRRSADLITPEEARLLLERGAVGNINLCWYGDDGAKIESPLDGRVIGMTLDQLRRAPRSVAVAGGPSKWLPIRGAIRGGWVKSIITDVGTAEALLDDNVMAAAQPG